MYLSDFQKILIEDIITKRKYDIFEFLYNNKDIDIEDSRNSMKFKDKILLRSRYAKDVRNPHFFIIDATLIINHINEYISLIEFLKSQRLIVTQLSSGSNIIKLDVSNPLDNKMRDYINDVLLCQVNRIIIIPSPELEIFKSKDYQTKEEIKDNEEREDRKKSLKYTRIALYITTAAILINILVEIYKSIFK